MMSKPVATDDLTPVGRDAFYRDTARDDATVREVVEAHLHDRIGSIEEAQHRIDRAVVQRVLHRQVPLAVLGTPAVADLTLERARLAALLVP